MGVTGVCEEGERRIWHFVIGKVDSELQKLGADSSHLQSSTVGRETKLSKVTTEAEYHLESADLETLQNISFYMNKALLQGEMCILCTLCVYVFDIFVTINSDFFPRQQK